MAHYQVILAYDGTLFKGFQRQARARTVQGVFEISLRHLGWTGASLLAAGRTDTGVHASGQVVSFELEWKHSLVDLLAALNAHLPFDVSAQQAKQVRADFHPRFSALSRRYQYSLVCQPIRQPLLERYTWRVWPTVTLENLLESAQLFTGLHDFAAFGSPPRAGSSTTRRVLESNWEQVGDRLVYGVTADAFLYHMVRRMVFFQVLVGQRKLSLLELKELLENGKLPNEHGIAPPQGLVLVSVNYPSDFELDCN